MDLSAAHAGFVFASCAISAIVIVILTVAIVLRTRQAERRVARLEAEGTPRRRSAEP